MSVSYGLRSNPASQAEHSLLQCLSRGTGGSQDPEDQMDTRWFVWGLPLAKMPRGYKFESGQPLFLALLVLREPLW